MTPSALPDASPGLITVGEWIRMAARRFKQAGIRHDQGGWDPRGEAAYLIAHALGGHDEPETTFARRLIPEAQRGQLEELIARRLQERLPANYLTREAFFAGRRFYVDARVLIPRSRIENLFDLEGNFDPPLPQIPVHHALDLGTGSGCLAVALAFAFPRARIDAADLSPEALAVATINRRRHRLERRLRLIHSDLFAALPTERYELIVTNPPYVPTADRLALPPEYQHEPVIALEGGTDGLDLIRRILQEAPRRLTPNGVLICETGDTVERTITRQWPDFPGFWIPFHFGASGVFAINRERLGEWLEKPERSDRRG